MAEKRLIKRPLITEKATRLEGESTYLFEVLPEATKNEIKKSIHELYHVDVVRVNIVQLRGKTRRFRGQPSLRSGKKKAMVTLAKGQTIEVS